MPFTIEWYILLKLHDHFHVSLQHFSNLSSQILPVICLLDRPLMKIPAWRHSMGRGKRLVHHTITEAEVLILPAAHISLQDCLLNYFPIHEGVGSEDTQNLNSTVPCRVSLSFLWSAVLFSEKNICVKDFSVKQAKKKEPERRCKKKEKNRITQRCKWISIKYPYIV